MSIKTLSPHYINIPLTSPLTGVVCNSYEVRIYIWDGSKTAVPAEPAYVMTKINASGASGSDRINIARIVNDLIEFSCLPQAGTVLVDGNNQVWVKYESYYNDQPTVPAFREVSLALKGYGYFLEGEDPQLPADKILLTGDEFKVSRGGRFVLPILVDEPPVPERTLVINSFTKTIGTKYTLTATANFPYSEISIFVRAVGSTAWIPSEHSGSNYIVPGGIDSGLFEVMATAFDPVTSAVIYSGPYTITAFNIYRILQAEEGPMTVYFSLNIDIDAPLLQLQGYNGPGWTDLLGSLTSPLSFTVPNGSYIGRLRYGSIFSNEVPFSVPLAQPINIP